MKQTQMISIKPIFILSCLFLLAGNLFSAHAQPTTAYEGVDIVFVVDQSGSMSGTGSSDQLPTDPQGLRFEAVQYALDSLVAYRQTIALDIDLRMAVIAFGDDTLEILDWVEISRFDDTLLWEQQRDTLINQLSGEFFSTQLPVGEDSLGNTNFLAGYESASAAFERIGTDSNNRLGVVITITDGEPCVNEPPYENICGVVVAQESYMRDVFDYAETAFPASNYDLYTIVLDSSGTLWQAWQDEWTQIVRAPQRALRVDTSQQFGVAFLSILREVVAKVGAGGETAIPPRILTPGLNTEFIPPYQRSARISIFKSTSSPGLLTVTRPDGMLLTEIDPSVTITNRDRPIEIWIISNPIPGNWLFEVGSTDDRIDVRLELIPVEVRVDVPTEDVQQYQPVIVTLSVLSNSGEPLPTYQPPFDVLNVVSEYRQPDGTMVELPLTQLISGVYEGQILAEQSGGYQVGFRAEVDDGTGSSFVIYQNDTAGSFTVGSISLMVDGLPEATDYLVNNTLTLHAQVVDETGTTLTLPQQIMEAALVQNGNRIPIEMVPTTAEAGDYEATVLLDTAGTYTLEVRATMVDVNGVQREIGTIASPNFNVLPSRPVVLLVTSPQDKSSDFARDGLFFEPQSIRVSFETRLSDDNALVDIFQIAADPTNILRFTVQDADGNQFAQDVSIQGQGGQYTIDLGELDRGTYTLILQLDGQLSERYVVPPQSTRVQVEFSRSINYIYIAAWVGIVVVGLAGLFGVGAMIRRRLLRRQHPARGTLIFTRMAAFGAEPDQIKTMGLDRYNSNYIVFGRGMLPKEMGLTKLIVECTDESMSSRKRIKIRAFRGKEEVVSGRILSPGQSVTIRASKEKGGGIGGDTYQIVAEGEGGFL